MSVRGLRLLCIPAVIIAALTVGAELPSPTTTGISLNSKKIWCCLAAGRGYHADSARPRHLLRPGRRKDSTNQSATHVHSGLNSSSDYSDATAIVSAAESNYCP